MGVPKKHKTRSGKRQRRSHHALKSQSFAICSNCEAPIKPHTVCKNCGYHRGRLVRKVK